MTSSETVLAGLAGGVLTLTLPKKVHNASQRLSIE